MERGSLLWLVIGHGEYFMPLSFGASDNPIVNFFLPMSAAGKRPVVPSLGKVDVSSIPKKTVEDNLAALPGALDFASLVNTFSQEQLAKALEFSLPGGLATAQKNIAAQLSGELAPEDTRALVSSATAAGFGRGFGPSMGARFGIGRNLVLRDLGLGVQEQKQRGLGNFLGLAQQTRAPQFNDFSSMFLTASQRLTHEQNVVEQQFNQAWLAEKEATGPSPIGKVYQSL